MNLRVHGGSERGRRLLTPRGVRPTQGVVTEAVFNMLGTAVLGASVVDLFAGSGALGIEALSRGAAGAILVERDHASAAVITRNLEALGYSGRARVARADALRWLEANPGAVAEATVILLDPPYRDPLGDRALAALDRLAAAGALVVAETARRHALPPLERLAAVRERRYGETAIVILTCQR